MGGEGKGKIKNNSQKPQADHFRPKFCLFLFFVFWAKFQLPRGCDSFILMVGGKEAAVLMATLDTAQNVLTGWG